MNRKNNIFAFINRLGKTAKAFLSFALVIAYILQMHMLFSQMQYTAMMLLAIPSIISAGLLGVRFGLFITILAAVYTFAFAYLQGLEFWFFLSKFSPGLVSTFVVVFFVGRIHELSSQYAKEIESRNFAETEIEKKRIELQLYADRLKHEIEDKFQTEQTLKKSEEQYRKLVEKSRIGILIDDIDGKFVYFNNQLTQMTLYTAEELDTMGFRDFVHPADLKFVEGNHSARMLGNEASDRYEFRLLRKDRSILFVEVDILTLKNKDGIYGSRGYIWDITARKTAEFALKESEERFRSIYNNASMGFYRMLPTGEVTMANPRFISMLKLSSQEEILNKKVSDVVEIDENRSDFFELLLKERKVSGYESEWYRKDGALFFGRETAWTIYDDSGELIFIDSILEDVTMRKQIEEEREQLLSLLQSAKSEIKILSGLLPICASCKKIRDESGNWSNVEQYIDENSEAEFSHGICPDCAARLYPGYL